MSAECVLAYLDCQEEPRAEDGRDSAASEGLHVGGGALNVASDLPAALAAAFIPDSNADG